MGVRANKYYADTPKQIRTKSEDENLLEKYGNQVQKDFDAWVNKNQYSEDAPYNYKLPIHLTRAQKIQLCKDLKEFGGNSLTYNAMVRMEANKSAIRDDKTPVSDPKGLLAFSPKQVLNEIEKHQKLLRDISREMQSKGKDLVKMNGKRSWLGQNLNPCETILKEYYGNLTMADWALAGKHAENGIKQNYDIGDQDHYNGNAYKHAYWNMLMNRSMGSEKAKQFADAHEFGIVQNGYVGVAMDLSNNQAGRKDSSKLTIFGISDDVKDMVTNGELVKYDGFNVNDITKAESTNGNNNKK